MKAMYRKAFLIVSAFIIGLAVAFFGFHQVIRIKGGTVIRETFLYGLKMHFEQLDNFTAAYNLSVEHDSQTTCSGETLKSGVALIRMPFGISWQGPRFGELMRAEACVNNFYKITTKALDASGGSLGMQE